MERSLYKLGESCVFRACALVGAAVIAVSAVPQNAAAQTERWHAREFQTGVFGQDNAVDVAFWKDGAGVEWVYMTGYHTTASGATVFATHRYAADDTGLATWDKRAFYPPDPATATGTNRAVAIEVDEDGNVYVTGESSDPNGVNGLDYVIIKYTKDLLVDPGWVNPQRLDGVVRWDNPKFGGTTSHDRPVDIALGRVLFGPPPEDNVVGITGRSFGGATQDDMVTVLFEANTGNLFTAWTNAGWGPGARAFDGTAHEDDSSVELDLFWVPPGGEGNLVVHTAVAGTTRSLHGAKVDTDIVTIRYDEFGNSTGEE